MERLADLGYRVLAVDLYLGKSATTHNDAWALMSALDETQSAARIDAAIGKLQKPGRRIATMAFSMGVPYALQASVRHGDEVSATVLFYGTTIRDTDQLKGLGGPVLSIMGSKDDPEDTIGFEQAMRSIDKPAEIYIYPGAYHAFAQPLFNEGKTYDAAATSIVWVLAEDFLKRNL